jgi:hypothetical protein
MGRDYPNLQRKAEPFPSPSTAKGCYEMSVSGCYESPGVIRSEAEALIGEPLGTVEFGRRSTQDQRLRRVAQMVLLYHDHHWSLERIAIAYDVSRERVRQILTNHNIERRPMQGHLAYRRTLERRREQNLTIGRPASQP